MRKILVLLIFLLIVLVVADRGLHYAAQNEIANRVSQQYDMASEPEVTISGIPFLTQAVSGEYSEVRIVTGALTVGEVQLERVDITAHDVEAPLGDLLSEPKVTAGAADAQVMLPYSELQKQLPEGIVIENENGQPRVSGDLAVLGFSVAVAADIEVTAEGDTFAITPSNIEVGESPVDVGAAVEEKLTASAPAPQLPFDLQVTEVEEQPNGVEVSAEASDIDLVNGANQE
ncbi:hypothetical protein F4561_004980 [Lipingzhangella halophila]|uniref:DUF2993 family protein n=1 Tax=Lipingzhangella halophila TaxID=1783352 RepID=A0A7W7RLG0_9ACTN|nr:DUF2993 domain-containing protein [Lipingzhangella halophila]MBB4934160.1 hypothetical protein [Lipingzhangella halophila]